MKVEDLLRGVYVIDYSEGAFDIEVNSIQYDSRKVERRDVFVCISGFKADGHDFIASAERQGASIIILENNAYLPQNTPWIQVKNSRKALAIMAANFYNSPSRKFTLVGVTGTNGKTTTTNLIANIFEAQDKKIGLIGTIHNRIGKEILPVKHTTPESPELQELFAQMVKKDIDFCTMEVSSHALELDRVYKSEFDIAVFTNLTQDHLDFHKDLDEYLRAKTKLFASLGKDARKENKKFAIINLDDPSSQFIMDQVSVPIITYGVKNKADVRATEIVVKPEGVSYLANFGGQKIPVNLNLTGLFNVYNSLAALAVGLVSGIQPEKIADALADIPGVPGRFETVKEGQDFAVVVDYAHTPDSLENVLRTARNITSGRTITVFGCGGDRDRTKRPLMGEAATRLSDICIVTSDNPRSEDSESIIDDIIPGIEKVLGHKDYLRITDRAQAIYKAIDIAQTGDIVVIAGKGHENYQILKDQTIHFDDKEVAREAIISRLRNERVV